MVGNNGLKGYGEGIPRSYVTGEHTEKSLSYLRDILLPMMIGREIDPADPAFIMEEADPVEMDLFPAALCAAETALLDMGGRALDQGLADYWGGALQADLTYSGVLPFSSPESAPKLLDLIKELGLSEVKIKVGVEKDEEITALARSFLGPDIRIRLDANCAWTPEKAVEMITRLSAYDIEAVEQPVPKEDVAGLAYVTERVQPCIIADESLCTLDDARRLIKEKAVGGFNLRLSKCGGPSRTDRLYRLAREEGLMCMLGSQVGELGFLSAAGRHFAASHPELRYLEGCFTHFVLGKDLIEEDLTFGPGGRASPLPGPGLGLHVRNSVLNECLLFSIS